MSQEAHLSFLALVRVAGAALVMAGGSDDEDDARRMADDVAHLLEYAAMKGDEDDNAAATALENLRNEVEKEREAKEAATQRIARTDVKPTGYDHAKALQELDHDATVTKRDDQDAQLFHTLLSAEDTKSILRGEPAGNFTDQFILARLDAFLGRPIKAWTEAGDRLAVVHA